MKDRISLYPGRVMLTPVAGQENVYDMVRADEPQEEGTPLNKANLLSDDTAMSLGLDTETATPNNALAMIPYLANHCVWRKAKQTYSADTEKTFSFNMYASVTDGKYYYGNFTYGTGYTISENGKVSLTGTFAAKATNSTNFDSLWSKKVPFYMMDNGQLYYVTSVRIPSSTYIEFNGNMVYFETSVTDVSYVTSSNSAAYPSGEIVDGWLYEKAGVLGTNAVSGQQTGSGTNAMSIDIGFTPKLLIITSDDGKGQRAMIQCGNTRDSFNGSATDATHLRVSLSSTAVLHKPYSAGSIFQTTTTYMWTAFR